MDDTKTTIQDLRDRVQRFNDDRDWQLFPTPKNLAVSIAIEAAELLAHLQWTDEPIPNQSFQLCEVLTAAVIYCLSLAALARLFV